MSYTDSVQWPGWETVKLIGRGSFGAVYEIQRDVFGDIEKAALKVISIPQNAGDIDEMYSDGYDDESITSTFQSHLKSIVAEYSLMRKMNGCANIVNCDDIRYVQHDDGIGWDIFIKMELLTPLTKVLPTDIPEETVIKIAKDMCAALELCKEHDIIHRDIKPQNIFVSSHGDYKLGDFGIAKTVEKTMGGTKIGTYKYMAPEVYNNQPYGSGADIYSLGLVLYWLLNEKRMPFLPLPPAKLSYGMEEEARSRRLGGEQLPPPTNGSAALQKIVLKACAYDQKDRYATTTEMIEALNVLDEKIRPIPMPMPVIVPTPTPNPEPMPAPIPIPEPKPAPKPIPNPEPTPKPTPVSPKRKNPWWLLAFAAVIFIALTIFIFVEKLPKRETSTTAQTTDPHIHTWIPANCSVPQTCSECGAIEGIASGHKWSRVLTNQFALATVRHILVRFEANTDQAKRAARVEILKILEEFQQGIWSEESFAALAKKYSHDISGENGGLYENVCKGIAPVNLSDWCLDKSRKPGDYGIVETEFGYHLIYFIRSGQYMIDHNEPQFCTECYEINGNLLYVEDINDNALVAWNACDVVNLSFHTLVADPTRAFQDQVYGASYEKTM